MTYTLQAFVSPFGVLSKMADLFGMQIQLNPQIDMLPITDFIRDKFQIPFLPLTDEGLTYIPESISQLTKTFSSDGLIAYVEAEFFGGTGTQASAVWKNGTVIRSIMVSSNAINLALKEIGVISKAGFDEFDTVGLGQFRDTNKWPNQSLHGSGPQ